MTAATIAKFRVVEHARERTRQRPGVAGFREQPGDTVLDDLGDAAGARGHHRGAVAVRAAQRLDMNYKRLLARVRELGLEEDSLV